MTPIRIVRLAADEAAAAVDHLAELLCACVAGGAHVSFVLPFGHADAAAFWRDTVLPSVHADRADLFAAYVGDRVVGAVQLDCGTPPNQPHRAEVRKLLVHPDARRQGIARALMAALEARARQRGRWLITLDTRTGGGAEPLYRSLGYIPVGAIPDFSRDPDGTGLAATTIMYKTL